VLNDQREPTSSFGSLGFTNAWTQQNALTANAASGNAFASVLLGYPNSGSILNNQAMAYSSHYWAGFIQDDWRILPKLTITLGGRWDYESPITDRYNRLEAGFDPNAVNPFAVPGMTLHGGLLFVTPNNRLPFHRDLNNFQPRVGFAFQVTPNTVLRGGFGISYLPTFDLPGFSSFKYNHASDGVQQRQSHAFRQPDER
jgi:outer membrane receptor protein involved in Fe transport